MRVETEKKEMGFEISFPPVRAIDCSSRSYSGVCEAVADVVGTGSGSRLAGPPPSRSVPAPVYEYSETKWSADRL